MRVWQLLSQLDPIPVNPSVAQQVPSDPGSPHWVWSWPEDRSPSLIWDPPLHLRHPQAGLMAWAGAGAPCAAALHGEPPLHLAASGHFHGPQTPPAPQMRRLRLPMLSDTRDNGALTRQSLCRASSQPPSWWGCFLASLIDSQADQMGHVAKDRV